MKNNSPRLFFNLAIFTFCLLATSQAQLISDANFSSDITTDNSAAPSYSDCNSIVTKSQTSVQTDRILLVRRGNYSYSLRFASQDGNILAFLISENGVKLTKGNQLFLMATDRSRRAFTFGVFQSLASPNKNSMKEHWMEMDPEDIIWLASNNISTIYLKDNAVNKMYKFTVAQPKQEALKKLAFCFLKETKD